MDDFAFIVHPRLINDVGRRLGKMLGIGETLGEKVLPKKLSNVIIKKLKGRLGFTLCSQFQVNNMTKGYIIAVLLTAEHMVTLPRKLVYKRILDAVLFAQNKFNVKRIGLGAYVAPFTLNGRLLLKEPSVNCKITHGDSLSAASAIPSIIKGAELKNINIQKSRIAVVGAYGVVGRGVALMLPELFPLEIMLTGPNFNKLSHVSKKIKKKYKNNIICSKDNNVIKNADIIILCTTAPGSIVNKDMLKKNALVVDMAQPHNMGREVSLARPDVLRVDGGFMSIPSVDIGFNMGTAPGSSFACFTETMILSLMGDADHHVDMVDVDFAKKVLAKSYEFGFTPAPLTNFSEPIFCNIPAKNQRKLQNQENAFPF